MPNMSPRWRARSSSSSFPDEVYNRGLRVITTINRADQQAAYLALRRGVMDYDRRHGYRGAEAYVDMTGIDSNQDEALEEHLSDYYDSDDLLPAIVLEAGPKLVRAYLRGGEVLKISDDGLKFAARMLDDKAAPNKRIRRGAVIRVQKADKGWQIVQLPEVEAAFVAASPVDGASPGAGRRLRFQSQQVQPRHPGLAPAGLQLQALHLLRRPGKGLYPGVGDRG
jgi:penicillin-binding protein 1A